MNKAVFLDRDGTLNVDTSYTYKPEDLELLPNVIDALTLLKAAGFLLIVITNQSGVGRGYYTLSDVENFHKQIQVILKKRNIQIDRFYICPHTPEDKCNCRKPSPYLIYKAAEDYDIDLSASFLLGDKQSDIESGQVSGVKSYLISENHSIFHWTAKILENNIYDL